MSAPANWKNRAKTAIKTSIASKVAVPFHLCKAGLCAVRGNGQGAKRALKNSRDTWLEPLVAMYDMLPLSRSAALRIESALRTCEQELDASKRMIAVIDRERVRISAELAETKNLYRRRLNADAATQRILTESRSALLGLRREMHAVFDRDAVSARIADLERQNGELVLEKTRLRDVVRKQEECIRLHKQFINDVNVESKKNNKLRSAHR